MNTRQRYHVIVVTFETYYWCVVENLRPQLFFQMCTYNMSASDMGLRYSKLVTADQSRVTLSATVLVLLLILLFRCWVYFTNEYMSST